MIQVRQLSDVVDWRLCIGCGACAYICPEDRIQLVDFLSEGIRPVVSPTECASCDQCLQVCPAVESDFTPARIEGDTLHKDLGVRKRFTKEWGPVLEIWEGYAADPEIRFKGSSGGALTAISAYCIEVLGNHGALHIAQDPEDPIRNRTRLSRSREELLAATGSRYSPASVCNGLGLVEQAPGRCVVIGKPAEIAGVCNARRLCPKLDRNIEVTLSFFCAESPSSKGTIALLEKMGMSPKSVCDLRYRGMGWPGHFAPALRNDAEPGKKMTYHESWAFLQAYRPWSVHLWPDGTGELADISCGDPWYEKPDGKNPGSSLVVVRTQCGREIIRGAMEAGYLELKQAEPWKLEKSQPGLLTKKGEVWGRRFALRMTGLPVTRFSGLDLWHCWRQLSFQEKLRSVVGTLRRILTRKLYRPLKLDRQNGTVVNPPVAVEPHREAGSLFKPLNRPEPWATSGR